METNIKIVLKDATQSFEKTFEAYFDEEATHINKSEKRLWAISSLIHLDQIRLFDAYTSCNVTGFPKLLWMAEILSKLFEGKKWYFRTGIKLLLEVAENKDRKDEINKKIKELRKSHNLEIIKSFEKYRNKFGYHYDAECIPFLKKFTKEEYERFKSVVETFVIFSKQWLAICKETIITKNLKD